MGLGADSLGQPRLHHHGRGRFVSDFFRQVLGRRPARDYLDLLSRPHQFLRQLSGDARCAVARRARRSARPQAPLVWSVYADRIARDGAAGADRRRALGRGAARLWSRFARILGGLFLPGCADHAGRRARGEQPRLGAGLRAGLSRRRTAVSLQRGDRSASRLAQPGQLDRRIARRAARRGGLVGTVYAADVPLRRRAASDR